MLLACASVIAFLTWGSGGDWGFVLAFRGAKLLAMLVVAYAVAVSSVLFQTITHNRILTPAIMGFDALYVLIQASIVFYLGANAGTALPPVAKFGLEVILMAVFASTLYRYVFSGAVASLHLMVLVGIIFGLLFRSLSGLMIRMIDPNEFLVLQDRMFASFNSIQLELLTISAVSVAMVSVLVWRMRHRYDVLALGRDAAIGLGIDYRKTVMATLLLIVVLVSVSTALVGPVTFFGLLVSNLAYLVMRSDRHKLVLPAAVLLAVIFLVGGQTVLERVLQLGTTVSVVIEFAGGLLFMAFIVRKVQR